MKLELFKLPAIPILCETEEGSEPEPPAEIQLVPAGKKIKARPEDGRVFRNSNPQRILDSFDIAIPIDFDHESEWAGGPAAGWIEKLKVKRGGAIWGDVEWTDRGDAAIRARHYRYISPALYYDEDGEISKVSSAAMVNRPALKLPALSSVQDSQPEIDQMEKAILAALNLPETATAVDAINRIAELAATAAKVADPPALEKYVPRADFTAMEERAQKAELALKKQDDEKAEAAILAAVDEACKAGKLTPGAREQALDMCRKSGLEAFRAFIEKAPKLGEPTDLDSRTSDPKTGTHGLTETELFVCTKLGLDPATFKDDDQRGAA